MHGHLMCWYQIFVFIKLQTTLRTSSTYTFKQLMTPSYTAHASQYQTNVKCLELGILARDQPIMPA